jgi:hypothetical protein
MQKTMFKGTMYETVVYNENDFVPHHHPAKQKTATQEAPAAPSN